MSETSGAGTAGWTGGAAVEVVGIAVVVGAAEVAGALGAVVASGCCDAFWPDEPPLQAPAINAAASTRARVRRINVNLIRSGFDCRIDCVL